MDVAYNQHSSHARRINRSTTNVNRLSLVPLTTKLPLSDDDYVSEALTAPLVPSSSYLQGRSAPTTPALLTRSPARSRSHSRRGSSNVLATAADVGGGPLPKSKSTTHLARHPKGSGAVSPAQRRRKGDDGLLSARDRKDSDWMLRAGALLSGEYREYKGQAWLVSRASSTSLAAGARDASAEEAAFERELAREREHVTYQQSRHGSVGFPDDDLHQGPASPLGSNGNGSRFGSRSQSRAGSRTQMLTPKERRSIDGYFAGHDLQQLHSDQYHNQLMMHHEYSMVAGPDFVNLDEKLEAIEQDTSVEDEAHVRRLVKREQAGSAGFWLGSFLGWRLFSVEENEEEADEVSDEDDGDDDDAGVRVSGGTTSDTDSTDEMHERRRCSIRQLENISVPPEERVAPPNADEGGWNDAAWLLSVASKVLL